MYGAAVIAAAALYLQQSLSQPTASFDQSMQPQFHGQMTTSKVHIKLPMAFNHLER
jgi:hypothetical protein